MGRLFGNDGIKGYAITEMSCELALEIGRAVAAVLSSQVNGRNKILVGKDARSSADALEAAICAGLCSSGTDAELVGLVPTPALAYLIRERGADGGIMITASHKTAEFNGVKIYDANGNRLDFAAEEEIERLILDAPEEITIAQSGKYGKTIRYLNSLEDYVHHVRSVSVSGDFRGIRVAIDCANGSAAYTAGKIFTPLGAEVILVANHPDGFNINRSCGSVHIDNIIEAVQKYKCSCGLAFDGGGERCLAVDENGQLVDGDQIIALIADYFRTGGLLRNNAFPVTSSNNLGLAKFAEKRGIRPVQCGSGERKLIRKLVDGGYSIGGDPSGQIFFPDDAPSADGQLTGVRLLEVLAHSDRKLSEMTGNMRKFPQVVINIAVSYLHHEVWKNDRRITALIEDANEELGGEGRVVVREVGGDPEKPIIRVKAEGSDFSRINELAVEVSQMIRERCAPPDSE